ncbi:MAG: TIGR02300 family protein [Holosporaceae bacterium]|jgi:uncharacterized protein (TIGR02300 family)|nr:TIGR02300 family protein [Holosporaceae bacterium]
MTKREDYGIKRVCRSCTTRFYDLNKSPIICPACGAEFDLEYLYKKKTKSFHEKADVADDIVIDSEVLEDEVDGAINPLEEDAVDESLEAEKDS